MGDPKFGVGEESMYWRIENDGLYYFDKTGSKHRLSKMLIVGNKNREVVIINRKNIDTPYSVHSDVCFKKEIPSNIDESNIKYFGNDIIWFVIDPPLDDVNQSIICEMNESIIPLLHYCIKSNIDVEIQKEYKQFLSNETKQALKK